jgi:hypothetical protein
VGNLKNAHIAERTLRDAAGNRVHVNLQGLGDRAAAIDTVWALMDPALFCRLTGNRRWSAARFRNWFTDCTLRLLLPLRDQQATATNQFQDFP